MSFDLGNILILKKDGTISPLNKHINRNRYKNNNINKVSWLHLGKNLETF